MFGKLYSKLQRITSNKLYFPEIDGIRFLAIILVILFHAHGYFLEKSTQTFTDFSSSYTAINTLLYNGGRGVQLFFILSGFILCLPFAQYYINNGKRVELKKYYLRRVTRLEPPYFIAMIALFGAALAMKLYSFSFLFPSLMASLVYLHNIIFQHTPYISVVAWSLEIEIQFYLMAPLLFRVLMLPKISRRPLLIVTALLFVFLQYQYDPQTITIVNYIQYFLFGILLADLYVSGDGISFLNRPGINFAAALLLLAICYIPFKTNMYGGFLFPFLVTGFFLIVLRNDIIKKLFSYKFIPIIGGMCYSIYLLHYPIISIFGRFTMPFKFTNYYLPNLFLQLVLLLIPVLFISALYYYFIERPFMSSKWQDKLMKKNKGNIEIGPIPAPEMIKQKTP